MEGEVKSSKHISEKKQKQSVETNQPQHAHSNENKISSNAETASATADNKDSSADAKPAKPAPQKLSKKSEATVHAQSLPISKKHGMYICAFIKNKPIDQAIAELEEVIKFKRAIPMKGEIPHRKHPGMMSGRYPINASKHFIQILKGLKGNAIVNQMDIEKTRIVMGSSSWGSRPMMKGGAKFKRTNIRLMAKEIQMKEKKQ